jgi:hypothetical protein
MPIELKLFILSAIAASLLCYLWVNYIKHKHSDIFVKIIKWQIKNANFPGTRKRLEKEKNTTRREYVLATWFGLFFVIFIVGIYFFTLRQ